MNWQEYQEQAASFFRRLGYIASVNRTLEGSRGNHDIDVVVEFKKNSFDCRWLIECKYWSSKVPKEKVLAFGAIVADTGADKGIMLSESGFQSGAKACASKTNILLTSLGELIESNELDLRRLFAEALLRELDELSEKSRAWLSDEVRDADSGITSRKSKLPEELLSRLLIYRLALEVFRDKGLPVTTAFDFQVPERRSRVARSVDQLMAAHKTIIEELSSYA